jgi:hypothetical protein
MNSLPSLSRLVVAICIGMLALAPVSLRAAETSATPATPPSADDRTFVIANGTFVRDGKSVPATVRNLVEFLVARYPVANVLVAGPDDVLLGDVTLRWGPGTSLTPGKPPIESMLVALSEMSGGKFKWSNTGQNTWVVFSAPTNNRANSRYAEVFNLGAAAGHNRIKDFERHLNDLETNLAIVRKVRGEGHPEVENLRVQVAVQKAHLAGAEPPRDLTKLIEEIQTTVQATLRQLKSSAKPPEFQFHPGTNLLIVIGGDEAIEVTRKVVAAIDKNPR